jgi:small subunit ribosomal protein S18
MQQKRFQRRKFCRFCADKTVFIDYKDIKTLRNYITERGKILSRKMTGACSAHQRELTTAIKRARNIALIPFMEK